MKKVTLAALIAATTIAATGCATSDRMYIEEVPNTEMVITYPLESAVIVESEIPITE
jgi:hypothetical protein